MKRLSLVAVAVAVLAVCGFCAGAVPVKLSLVPSVETSPSRHNLEGLGLGILGANYQDAEGVSLSLIWTNVDGDMNGTNGAYIFTRVQGAMSGHQAALVCINGKMSGIQTGFYTQTDDLHGYQVGIINNSQNVKGLQLGLVNIARSLRGVQIGLVNVAKTGGFAPVMVIINASF